MVEMAEIVVSRRTFLIGLFLAFLASILISTVISTQLTVGPQGPKGEKGDQGPAGASGADGVDGVDGTDGLDGKAAYELWLSEGNSGTEQDFLDSLRGEQGPIGPEGPQGPPGVVTIENFTGWLSTPAYDSGWIDILGNYSRWTLNHGLNTTEVLIYAVRNNSEYGINNVAPAGSSFSIEWLWLTTNELTVRVAPMPSFPSYDEVRFMIWMISEG